MINGIGIALFPIDGPTLSPGSLNSTSAGLQVTLATSSCRWYSVDDPSGSWADQAIPAGTWTDEPACG